MAKEKIFVTRSSMPSYETDHSDIFDGIWLCCFKQRLYTTDIFVFLYAVVRILYVSFHSSVSRSTPGYARKFFSG